jgi:hypothetical protein
MQACNRHCKQNYPFVELATQYGRMLRHGQAPRMSYVERRPNEYRSICHQGQRKLLISEIELLTQACLQTEGTISILVVYAGAAPGIHIPFLADMYPQCRFHLYDPARFGIKESERVQIFNRLFTCEDAVKEQGVEVVISDIRTQIDEQSVRADMMLQQECHRLLCPATASLKFRLPWDEHPCATVEYLYGDIYLPVWGRTSTTECRLFMDRKKARGNAYQPLAYEEEMSHFNRVIRPAVHLHSVKNMRFDRCYDYASEIWILRQYLQAFHVSSRTVVVALAEAISESFKMVKI